MFNYKLGLHFESSEGAEAREPAIVDLAYGGEVNTRDGESQIPFVKTQIGLNISSPDVIIASARALVGAEITSVNPIKGESLPGGRVSRVDLIRVSEETIETFPSPRT